MTTTFAPDRTEAAEYDFTYIDQVGAGEICALLEAQLPETLPLLREISEERALAYIGIGHVTHHAKILRERYLERQA